jgi:hypothetical protein
VSVLHEQAAVEALSGLSGFRDGFYDCLDARADALFELADAAICADGPVTSLVELSLAPVFRRGHGALYDALADGAVDEDRLRDLLAGQLPADVPLMRLTPRRTRGRTPSARLTGACTMRRAAATVTERLCRAGSSSG